MTLAANLQRPLTLVTVTHDGPADIYGNATERTSTAAVLGYIEQTQRGEDTNDRDVSSEEGLLLLPAGTVVNGLSRVVDGAVTWQVDGTPWSVRRPSTNAEHHLEARLRRAN